MFISYNYPYLELDISCSKGTYIRSIANDIGKILGCGAYLEKLTRTRLGKYYLEDAIDQNKLTDIDLIKNNIKNENYL